MLQHTLSQHTLSNTPFNTHSLPPCILSSDALWSDPMHSLMHSLTHPPTHPLTHILHRTFSITLSPVYSLPFIRCLVVGSNGRNWYRRKSPWRRCLFRPRRRPNLHGKQPFEHADTISRMCSYGILFALCQ